MFGLKYEMEEKAKKYRNIIKEKIQKSKYNKNRRSPFLIKNEKLLTLPNIGERTDYDWNALTQIDFNAHEHDDLKREFTADSHVLLGRILEPNDIGYGEDPDEDNTLEQ